MIPLPPTVYAALGGAIVIAVLSGAVYVQTTRLASVKAEYALFVTQVKAAGDAQNAAAKAKDIENATRKEKADAQNARTRSALTVALDSLRKSAGAGRGGLSAPAPSTASPARTCFDPAKFSRALRSLDEGLLGVVEIGSRAVIDLDTAKAWARK